MKKKIPSVRRKHSATKRRQEISEKASNEAKKSCRIPSIHRPVRHIKGKRLKALTKKEKIESMFERTIDDIRAIKIRLASLDNSLRGLKLPSPELTSVERLMVACKPYKSKFDCMEYRCYSCDVDRRNSCWSDIQKVIRRTALAKGLPYSMDALSEMKRSDLVSVAGMLGINAFKVEDLAIAIYSKQEALKASDGGDNGKQQKTEKGGKRGTGKNKKATSKT